MTDFRIEDAECTAETETAILVEAPDFDEPEWIPQSQITEDSDVWRKGDDGVLMVTEWWAEKKGWV